ncbi:MAG: hypothetical protein H7Z72_04130, partial [Bacteroidetes bacterium]|nr:hypothetical protein [Fibrella sp.]
MVHSAFPPKWLTQSSLSETSTDLTLARIRAWFEPKLVARICFVVIYLAGSLMAQAQITGTVFRDYNANGIRDAGEPGKNDVVVKAFLSSGAVAGNATTDANGAYSLAPSGVAPFRIEFTSIGTNYFEGSAGPGSGTSVQFVYTANAKADLGVYNATEIFCKPNPQVAVPCYINGDPLKDIGTPGSASVQDALVWLAYNSQGTAP